MTDPAARGFTLQDEALDLPAGASARGTRSVLRHDGKPVLAFSRGVFRPYLHPVFTPSGFCATAECPADHPHHAGIWIGADRVFWCPENREWHTYNFYVDEVFQGRAPGRIEEVGLKFVPDQAAGRVEQEIIWRSPREWGAQDGRVIMKEHRTTAVAVTRDAHLIDIVSWIDPVGGEIRLGPTRHAWLNLRVAETMSLLNAGQLTQSKQRAGGPTNSEAPKWMRFSGPVGGGNRASVAVLPAPESGGAWFAAAWGVVTVGPFRHARLRLLPGNPLRLAYRVVVSDGDLGDRILQSMQEELPDDLSEEAGGVRGA